MSDEKQYPIPRGWRRVTRGNARWTDEVWDSVCEQFVDCKWRNVPATQFVCVIRRVKKGGAK